MLKGCHFTINMHVEKVLCGGFLISMFLLIDIIIAISQFEFELEFGSQHG
jgi:hypothetical protein